MKSNTIFVVIISILSAISLISCVLLYRSIQEENRLEAIITGYEQKVSNVEERNVRITSYTNHVLMLLEAEQQKGN